MAEAIHYPLTRQGVRDLDHPIHPNSQVNVGPAERTASLVGGAILAGFGLSRANPWGLLLAAAGGALVYRGVGGRSSAFAAIGRNTARRSSATRA